MTSADGIHSLQTPALLLDRATLVRNCDRMREKALRSNGVSFRPHVKTHKVPEIGRLQHGGTAGPITVSTLAEAETFASDGFDDITYAVPIAPDKLERVRALMRRIRRLNILVDHEEALDALESSGSGEAPYDVFLKVDCGYHRAGVDPRADSSLALAKRLASSKSVRFHGLLTHAGHSYNATSVDQILEIADDEREAVRGLAARAAQEGIAPLVRSIGSTPTASLAESFEGVDEVRPGNYVFYDAFQATIGSCSVRDCAVSVLASVIGIYREENRLMLDAGALALSKDTGPSHLNPRFGYGLVCDLDLQPLPLRIDALSQEHGKVSVAGQFDFGRIAIGSKLRIIPNHSCLTAAMFDRYFVIEGSTLVDQWKPVRGW